MAGGGSTFSGDETAPFFGFLGAAAALLCILKVVSAKVMIGGMGAAYGTAKSGVGVASMGVMRPELVMKSIVPVVMAGVLGIYGLIIAVIISTGINPKAKSYYLFDGYAHLSSGLACGLAGLSAGMAIGIVGDAGVREFGNVSPYLTTTGKNLMRFMCYNFEISNVCEGLVTIWPPWQELFCLCVMVVGYTMYCHGIITTTTTYPIPPWRGIGEVKCRQILSLPQYKPESRETASGKTSGKLNALKYETIYHLSLQQHYIASHIG
ncbi:V-type proton ATPase 16 kDa proteolipid subunit [Artemisia annua]|uniref:V-type proton ATPase proteolipid subunit n=1 Tax=Artemisia annua TaxID=35608 RepID=A0A2U1Q1K9_ARTAN|nr:V-type proton ATPase 16 kDa proteolipid subunit [Artemisia annua]